MKKEKKVMINVAILLFLTFCISIISFELVVAKQLNADEQLAANPDGNSNSVDDPSPATTAPSANPGLWDNIDLTKKDSVTTTKPAINFRDAISSIAGYFYSGVGVGPTKTNWYEVEQWEIDACRIWGGASSAVRSSSGADEISTITLSQLTASLQAKKYSYPDNTTLYEASWYVEPITGSVTYKILWINNKGESEVLVPSATDRSYYLPIGPILNNATNNYTRMELRKSDNTLLIRTKIVENTIAVLEGSG